MSNQTGQYPNENRKKQNSRNVLFTVLIGCGVGAVAALTLLIPLAWRNPDSGTAIKTPDQVVSESEQTPNENAESQTEEKTADVSSELEIVSDASSAESETESKAESETTSSTIVLEGKIGKITQSSDRLLVVVNNSTKLPSSFKTNLTKIGDVKVDKELAEAFDDMYNAAAKSDLSLWITYGYRSEKQQKEIYSLNVKSLMEEGMSKKEAQAVADKTIQQGGKSEYVTGLSVGLNTAGDEFADTSEYKWLIKNGAKYGFILRYPEDKEDITGVTYQPWRFRYVGKKNAQEMQKLDMCLEEYVQYLNSQEEKSASSTETEENG